MGKLISLINITLDGFCDSQYVNASAEFHEFVHTLLVGTKTVAFGRGSFELFQTVWPGVLAKSDSPESQRRMAQALNDVDKVVFSNSLTETSWPNSSIIADANVESIKRLKNSHVKNVLIIGSPGIVSELTKMRQIDDYYFSIQPVIAGSGSSRLFTKQTLTERLALTYVDRRELTTGVQILHFNREHADAEY